jgi:hypothetical protein
MGGKRGSENGQLKKEEYDALKSSSDAGNIPVASEEVLRARRRLKVAAKPAAAATSSSAFGGVSLTSGYQPPGGFSFAKLVSSSNNNNNNNNGPPTTTQPGFRFGTNTSKPPPVPASSPGTSTATTGSFGAAANHLNNAGSNSNNTGSNMDTLSGEETFWMDKREKLNKEDIKHVLSLPQDQTQDLTDVMASYLIQEDKIAEKLEQAHQNRLANNSGARTLLSPSSAAPPKAADASQTGGVGNLASGAPAPSSATPPFVFGGGNNNSKSPATPSTIAASPLPAFSVATATSTTTGVVDDTVPAVSAGNNDTNDKAQTVADPDWDDIAQFEPVIFLRHMDDKWSIFTKNSKLRVQMHKDDSSHRMVVRDEILGKVFVNMRIFQGMKFAFSKQKSRKGGEFGTVVFKGINDVKEGAQTFMIKSTVAVAEDAQRQLSKLAP